MTEPTYILLYVDNPTKSAGFYSNLFDKKPVELSETFALFALNSGLMFGLWSMHTVQPTATPVGGTELCITVADIETVNAMHKSWSGRGMPVVQKPTQMDFGYTFVATDPDGHRLRVFARTE